MHAGSLGSRTLFMHSSRCAYHLRHASGCTLLDLCCALCACACYISAPVVRTLFTCLCTGYLSSGCTGSHLFHVHIRLHLSTFRRSLSICSALCAAASLEFSSFCYTCTRSGSVHARTLDPLIFITQICTVESPGSHLIGPLHLFGLLRVSPLSFSVLLIRARRSHTHAHCASRTSGCARRCAHIAYGSALALCAFHGSHGFHSFFASAHALALCIILFALSLCTHCTATDTLPLSHLHTVPLSLFSPAHTSPSPLTARDRMHPHHCTLTFFRSLDYAHCTGCASPHAYGSALISSRFTGLPGSFRYTSFFCTLACITSAHSFFTRTHSRGPCAL